MRHGRPASGRDLGDFQTPPALARAVLRRLERLGRRWDRLLEPTCGRGAFLAGALDGPDPPSELRGIELQPGHHGEAAALLLGRAGGPSRAILANVFDLDLSRDLGWERNGPLLVVGNPPWVTSAELGTLGSGNHPRKHNGARARGIDAMTGASNFDLAEAVWIKLMTELAGEAPTLAMLVKESVARRALEHASRVGLPVSDAWFARIDARAWFNASVEAGLLCLTIDAPGARPGLPERVPVYADLDATTPASAMGVVAGRIVADIDAYRPFAWADGTCPVSWRQGAKHDAAPVMELTEAPGGSWRNGLGEFVDVEPSHVYPLAKGSCLVGAGPSAARRFLIVTQAKAGGPTDGLERDSPRLWRYLRDHDDVFLRRKSSVYRNAPAFAMFGIGPYSFAPYKVAVSSLRRPTTFRAVGPVGGRPVLFDDTCYLLPFQTAEAAALAVGLLNSPESVGLLGALTSPGAKRAVTKAALQRVDLPALLERADRHALLASVGETVTRLNGRPPEWPSDLAGLIAGEPPLRYDL